MSIARLGTFGHAFRPAILQKTTRQLAQPLKFTSSSGSHQRYQRVRDSIFRNILSPEPSPKNNFPWIGVSLALLGAYLITRDKEVTLEELEEHRSKEKGLWIAWRDPKDGQWKVSAMADFVAEHPGGDQILEAGGQDAMPFWQRFARHLDPMGNPSPQVLKELRKRLVGVLKEPPPEAKTADPYRLEPHRPESPLTVLQKQPYCAGQKPMNLRSFITEDIFVRSHGPVAPLEDYSLTIETPRSKETFTLESLQQHRPTEMVTTVECTGNRRAEVPNSNGLPWEAAIANVQVTGYRFSDILQTLYILPHEEFYVIVEQRDSKGTLQFSTCIPLKELPRDTLLVTEVNGESSRDHTGSLRFWPMGFYGNFLVKNPTHIKIVYDYKAPDDKVAQYADLGKDWSHAVALSDNLVPYVKKHQDGSISLQPTQRVNALAFVEKEGLKVAPDAKEVTLRGWAWSGGGRHIASVKVSADQGKTWGEATLNLHIEQPRDKRYAWTGWEINIPICNDTSQLLVKATDSEGNVQPDIFDPDPRGLRNNTQLKIPIRRE